MKKGVTLKNIATKLHMSVSTVSKALSEDPTISVPTRERVKKLASEWQYIPNEAARHFKQNKTFTLGIVIPDLLGQFYVLGINAVEKVAAEKKYHVIVSQSHEDAVKEEKIVDLMIRNRVDGVIAVISKNTSDMTPFKKLLHVGIPVVFYSRAPTENCFHYVSADNEDGAFKATEFLIKKGHKRIAHLMGLPSMPVSSIRLEGYKKALQKSKIPYDSALVKIIDFSAASTYQAMSELISIENPPTAIFIFKNYVSIDVISYLKKFDSLKLEKIDLVAFGNLPFIEYLDHKPLASVEENSYAMGIEAANLLFHCINTETVESNNLTRHIKVPCKLIIHKA